MKMVKYLAIRSHWTRTSILQFWRSLKVRRILLFQQELVPGRQRVGLPVGQLRGEGEEITEGKRWKRRRMPQAARKRSGNIDNGQGKLGHVWRYGRGQWRSGEPVWGRSIAPASRQTSDASSVRTRRRRQQGLLREHESLFRDADVFVGEQFGAVRKLQKASGRRARLASGTNTIKLFVLTDDGSRFSAFKFVFFSDDWARFSWF